MTRFNHSHFPMFVGFDRMFNEMESLMTQAAKLPNWPPYNVKKTGDNTYCIEMAVAGFGKSDLDIEMRGNELHIKGEVKPDENSSYLHKGIAERGFERKFNIADSVVIKNAELVNGMLKIVLENVTELNKNIRKIALVDKSE